MLPENLSGLGAQPPGGPRTSAAIPPGQTPPDAGQGGTPASQQEQAIYDRFVGNALKALWNKKGLPAMVRAMNTRDPREGVARVTAQIVARVAQSAGQAGEGLPTDVLWHGSAEIFANVLEMAEEAGIHQFSQDPKATQGAMVRAFDEIRLALDGMGMIDEDEFSAMLQEAQAADQAGTLAQSLGITPDMIAAEDPMPGAGEEVEFEEDGAMPGVARARAGLGR